MPLKVPTIAIETKVITIVFSFGIFMRIFIFNHLFLPKPEAAVQSQLTPVRAPSYLSAPSRVSFIGVSSPSLTAVSTLPAASDASRAFFILGKLNETG